MADFYDRFQKDLELAGRTMTDIKRMEKPTDLICDKCGKPMVIKWGRHGSFIACTGYPECSNTRELAVDLPDVDKADLTEQDAPEYCENCGRPMVLKKGRFGQFYACSGYPDCKTTKQIGGEQKKSDVPLEEKCPQCGNNLCVEERPVSASSRLAATIRNASSSSRRPSGFPAPTARKAKWWSGVPNAARRSTAATAIRSATSWRGASRSPRSVPIADRATWSKNGSRPVGWAQCPNGECKYKRPIVEVEATA